MHGLHSDHRFARVQPLGLKRKPTSPLCTGRTSAGKGTALLLLLLLPVLACCRPSTPAAPVCGWTTGGEGPHNRFGFAEGRAGDANGDGYDDVIVGGDQYRVHQAGLCPLSQQKPLGLWADLATDWVEFIQGLRSGIPEKECRS